ncbi:ABC transporter ATP-binding protein [Corticibacterium sp. UT-5YL-CI-8]|nr:ABC transporter ATP-binding protein [Tianweitania sp. UT-5YL-CI-8]
MTSENLLDVRDLTIAFRTPRGYVEAVRGVDFVIRRGEVMSLVGESGSGKSVTMRALMGLLPETTRISGSARFLGQELIQKSGRGVHGLRGARMSMIFQDPMTALNPVMAIGAQVAEAIRIHNRSISRQEVRDRAVKLLRDVAIPFPEQRFDQYPHQFSGGMRQRVVIAMAIANRPDLIIADEPTTALDVTVQAQILELLRNLCAEYHVGLALITHDLGVVAGMAQSISVMYAGAIVERGSVEEVFYNPSHPYTRGLLGALPHLTGRIERLVDIGGNPPTIFALPEGCAFSPRCAFVQPRCRVERPLLRQVRSAYAACHFAETLPAYPVQEMQA